VRGSELTSKPREDAQSLSYPRLCVLWLCLTNDNACYQITKFYLLYVVIRTSSVYYCSLFLADSACCHHRSITHGGCYLLLECIFYLLSWASQQYFSLTPIQHQSAVTSQPIVFFSHNKSAPATGHQPVERGENTEDPGMCVNKARSLYICKLARRPKQNGGCVSILRDVC
jgi:hypothetical protein